MQTNRSNSKCRLAARKARMGGQTLVLMPVVLLVITVFFCIGFNISWYAKKRIAVQEAADSASIGGARVQDMMLESIATGNDAIAINLAKVGSDVANLWDVVIDIKLIEDIIKRIEWIKSIRSAQNMLTGERAMLFTEAAVIVNGPAAGADISVACVPSSSNIYGFSVPTLSSNPGTYVDRPIWTFFLFLVRKSNTPWVPDGFRISEKPVVIAFSNLDKKLGFPVPFLPEENGKQNGGSYLVATSASSVYFIPWGPPMNRDWMEESVEGALTGMICMMIPGPFWGARLEEVGWQGWGSFGGGVATWVGKRVLSYGLQQLSTNLENKLLLRVERNLDQTIEETNEVELETIE